MNKQTIVQRAKQVIHNILYITIATVDSEGNPWNTPVYSAHSDSYTFYWVSDKENQHSQNILNNKKAFLVIYDSTVPEGTGFGVYFEGNPDVLDFSQIEESKHAANLLASRKNKVPRNLEEYNGEYPRRIFKFTPSRIYVNVDGEKNGNFVDTRIDITNEILT